MFYMKRNPAQLSSSTRPTRRLAFYKLRLAWPVEPYFTPSIRST